MIDVHYDNIVLSFVTASVHTYVLGVIYFEVVWQQEDFAGKSQIHL